MARALDKAMRRPWPWCGHGHPSPPLFPCPRRGSAVTLVRVFLVAVPFSYASEAES